MRKQKEKSMLIQSLAVRSTFVISIINIIEIYTDSTRLTWK